MWLTHVLLTQFTGCLNDESLFTSLQDASQCSLAYSYVIITAIINNTLFHYTDLNWSDVIVNQFYISIRPLTRPNLKQYR